MTDLDLVVANLPDREKILILRSVTHVAAEEKLPEALHFHNRVTDLDAARLIHQIERGAIVVQQGAAWTDRGGTLRKQMPHLTRIVNECLRLGLVHQNSREMAPGVWLTWLEAAPVHLIRGDNRTACDASRRVRAARFRLTDDIGLVDCHACLDGHQ